MPTYDFTEIEAAFNAEADKVDALILERWADLLKRQPVKGDAPNLPAELPTNKNTAKKPAGVFKTPTSTSTTAKAGSPGGPAADNPFDLAHMKSVLRTQHGGPGPHKSGSSQDVHGDRGAGAGGGKQGTSFPTWPDKKPPEGWARKNVDGSDEVIHINLSDEQPQQGTMKSLRVEVRNNGEGILKENTSRQSWGDLGIADGFARRDVAAYEIDQALELGIVPETIGLPSDNEEGYLSLQSWIENADTGWSTDFNFEPPQLADDEAIGKLSLLDMIGGNYDRHGLNWLTDDYGNLHAIDNGLFFTTSETNPGAFYNNGSEFFLLYDLPDQAALVGKPYLPATYRDRLQKFIDSGSLAQTLSSLVTGPKHQSAVDAGLARAQYIVDDWDRYFSDELYGYGD